MTICDKVLLSFLIIANNIFPLHCHPVKRESGVDGSIMIWCTCFLPTSTAPLLKPSPPSATSHKLEIGRMFSPRQRKQL